MAARRKLIKIALERVTRTDLICIACGNFRTEWAVVPAGDAEEAIAGCHTKCMDGLHVRRLAKKEVDN